AGEGGARRPLRDPRRRDAEGRPRRVHGRRRRRARRDRARGALLRGRHPRHAGVLRRPPPPLPRRGRLTMPTTKQTAYIKGLARRAFPDDGAYRHWLKERWDVESSTELSTSRAVTAIDELKAMADGRTPEATHRGRYYGAGQAGYAWRLTQDQADEIARY